MTNKHTMDKAMTNYAIYQLPSDHASYRDLYFMDFLEIQAISDEYEVVAHITARSMDEVFRIGNFVCEEDASKIEIVDKMRSISTGDIVHNLDTDETFVCAAHGWDMIVMKECA